MELPTGGHISALNIPHSSIVFDHHETVDISTELLDGDGMATETIRYADIVSFTCLKAFALDQRHEYKDAYDLIYCIEHADGGLDVAAKAFQAAREGKHAAVVKEVLTILERHFADAVDIEGYKKGGPVAVAKFEESGDDLEHRVLRQREASDVIMRLLEAIG